MIWDELHKELAALERDGQAVMVKNALAALPHVLRIADIVPPGTALTHKTRWARLSPTGFNVNALNPGLRTDMGEKAAAPAEQKTAADLRQLSSGQIAHATTHTPATVMPNSRVFHGAGINVTTPGSPPNNRKNSSVGRWCARLPRKRPGWPSGSVYSSESETPYPRLT